ncbi:hypothetical protein OC844_006845, partial [Tilletia horrida]
MPLPSILGTSPRLVLPRTAAASVYTIYLIIAEKADQRQSNCSGGQLVQSQLPQRRIQKYININIRPNILITLTQAEQERNAKVEERSKEKQQQGRRRQRKVGDGEAEKERREKGKTKSPYVFDEAEEEGQNVPSDSSGDEEDEEELSDFYDDEPVEQDIGFMIATR